MSQFEIKASTAKKVTVPRLRELGLHVEAEAVERLIRSGMGAVETARRLHDDNKALRARLGGHQ